MKKEDFGMIGFLIAAVVCCLILTLIITGSLSIITGFFSGRNIYIIVGVIVLLVAVYLYWKKLRR